MGLFAKQLGGLLKKSLLVKKRQKRTTFMEIFYPVYFLAILVIITKSSGSSGSETLHNQPIPVADMSIIGNRAIGFSPNNAATVALVDSIKGTAGLGFQGTFQGFASPSDLRTAISGSGGSMWGGIAFSNINEDATLSKNVGYELISNSSLLYGSGQKMFSQSGYLTLERAILQSIVNEHLKVVGSTPNFELQISTREYPTFPSTFSAIPDVWAFYTLMAFFLVAMQLTIVLVSEKEEKLKEGLLMMGCIEMAYWVSWFIVELFILLVTVLISLAIFFASTTIQHSNFFLCFVLLFLYAISVAMLGFIISIFFDKPRSAVSASGLMMIYFLGFYALAHYYVFPMEDLSSGPKYIMMLLSPVAFGEVWYIVGQLEVAQNTGLTFSNISTVGTHFSVPGAIGFLILDIFLYWVILWYLSKVWKGEYGTSLGLFFFLRKDYWCPQTRHGLLEGSRSNDLIIDKLRKEFKSGCFKKKKTVAVHGLELTVHRGEILALLGHNGAGKSTTIHCLTGLCPPTSGDARILGYSISRNMEQLRRRIGVCPQHDVLFKVLTAKEHIDLYASIKGIRMTRAQVMDLLSKVGLEKELDSLVSTFSGGMKRRLSTSIAFVGDPAIIFLDEPTTGVDPQSRRLLWKELQRIKQDRVVILTTHSMEEADVLADFIGIMSHGKLRCFGTSMQLKQEFGLGYYLEMVGSQGFPAQPVKEFVEQRVPGAKTLSARGAEFLFLLPLDAVDKFADFLEELDERKEELGIDSYGLSMTTLEEVFLKIIEAEEAGQTIKLSEASGLAVELPESDIMSGSQRFYSSGRTSAPDSPLLGGSGEASSASAHPRGANRGSLQYRPLLED